MRKYLLLNLFLLCCAGRLFAQYDNRFNLDSLLRVINVSEADTNKLDAYHRVAAYYLQYKIDSAELLAKQGIQLADKLGVPTKKARLIQVLAVSCKQKGDLDQALSYQLEALRYFEEKNDLTGIAICSNDIGVIYKNLKQYDKALEYYRRSYAYCLVSPKLRNGQLMTLNNIGTIHDAQGRFDSAQYYYERALALAKETGSNHGMGLALNNLGELYAQRGQHAKAISYYQQVFHYDSLSKDQVGSVRTLTNLGSSSFAMKNIPQTYYYLNRALNLSRSLGYPQGELEVSSVLSNVLKEDGRYKEAVVLKERVIFLSDSLQEVASKEQIAEMEARYQVEKKGRENAELSSQNAKMSNQRNILIGVVILLVLAAAFVYRAYRLRQALALQKERNLQQEKLTRAIIKAEDDERERIARDLHDGIGQQMAALNLQLNALEVQSPDLGTVLEPARQMVGEAMQEVRSVSHNMMPSLLLRSGLNAAVRDFLQKIDLSGQIRVNLDIIEVDDTIPTTTASVLFRVMQELVSNILKHARATEMNIQLIQDESEIRLMIEDNGIGIDVAQMKASKGMGLKNLNDRVSFLHGQLHFDSSPGKGTTVTVEIPITPETV